jgi:hypothetical protein
MQNNDSGTSNHISLNNLPSRPTLFVNRDQEIGVIKKDLFNMGNKRVSIWGEAGVGKTYLAREIAHQLKEMGVYHAIVWTTAKEKKLGFSGIDSRVKEKSRKAESKKEGVWVETLTDLYRIILEVSHHPEFEGRYRRKIEPTIDEVIIWLKIRKILVVIDDLDNWKDIGLLLNFVGKVESPSVVLLTTRRRLAAEQVRGLAPIPLGPLSREDSENILQRAMTEEGIQLHPDEQSLILDLSDGNPLIVDLASALAFRMKRTFRSSRAVINKLARLGSSRPIERYLFDDLYKYLTGEAKRVFLAIAVLYQTLPTIPTIEQIVKLSEINPDRFEEILIELQSASLVNRKESDPNRWDMHILARDFALYIEPERANDFRQKISTILQI